MSETCANCGEEVDKEPIVLCDECGGEPCGMTASDAVTVLAQRDALLAACEAMDGALAGLRGEIAEAAEVDANWEVVDKTIDALRAAIAAAKGTR